MNTRAAAMGVSLVCAVTVAVHASILTVTNTNDDGPGAGLLAVDGNGAGAVFRVMSDDPVTISDLTISNAHGGSGGGIFNGGVGTLRIINSALSGNTADLGGGVYNGGTLTVVSSTISGNTGNTEGVGIYNAVTLTIINHTLSNNTSHSNLRRLPGRRATDVEMFQTPETRHGVRALSVTDFRVSAKSDSRVTFS